MKRVFTILIPDRLKPPADIEASVFGDKGVILLKQAKHVNEIEDNIWKTCHAVLAWHDLQYTEPLLHKMARCKVIVRVGVGFDNVDLNAAKKRGIVVCNVPDYGTNDVADHALAFLLQAERGLQLYQQAVLGNQWSWDTAPHLRRITGLNLGIIGFGRIGKAVALRAKAFGINVAFYDPYVPEGIDKTFQITRLRTRADLAQFSDVVSIHVPLTQETKGFINEEFFKKCRMGITFINTARGGVLDIYALYNAMKSGKVQKAALDVLPVEPPDSANPLVTDLKNNAQWLQGRLAITPHAAFFNQEAYAEMRRKAAEEALRVLMGSAPYNPVN